MSDRRVLAALLLACSAALPAQQGIATMEARSVALRTRADSLSRQVKRMEAFSRDSGLVVDVREGSYRLRTTTTLAPVATVALRRAVQEARRVLGPEADTLGSRMRLALREQHGQIGLTVLFPGATAMRQRISSASLDGLFDGGQLTGAGLDWPLDADDLASNLMMLIERSAAFRLPAPTATWLNHRLPMRDESPEFWPDLYRALTTSPVAVVRRCVAGDRLACRNAFVLDTMPTDRVAAWYDVSDYPGIAGTAGDGMQRNGMYLAMSVDERDDCTVRGQLDACRRIIALLPVEAFRIPMPDAGRASLARIALATGGVNAIGRLRASGGSTVAQQLTAAANVPADSVIALWQARLIASRPSSPLPGPSFVLASLACIAACIAWSARGKPWV